jgi:hypothetical protein
MRTLVESKLPPQFLLDLGTYMQTAAQIELAVWQTTMHAEGIDPHSVEEYRGYVGLKLKTTELIRRFKESAQRCPTTIAKRIGAVAAEVERGVETRNLAAHGAFFVEDETEGTLGAAHYFARGHGKARELFEVKQTLSRHDVEEVIKIANQLLHDVIALRQTILDWRYPDGMPELTDLPPENEPDTSRV